MIKYLSLHFRKISLKKIHSFVFYFFIFLIPFQSIFIFREAFVDGEKFQYATVGLYIFEVVLLLLMLISFFTIKNISYSNKALNNSIALFILWSLLSVFWSEDKDLALLFSFRLSLGVALFVLIKRFNFDTKKIVGTFLASMFLHSILGSFQFFTQSTFSNKYLGLSNYIISEGGVSVLENTAGRWLRAYGGMPHPNILGGFLAVSLVLGILFYIKLKNQEHCLKKITLIIVSINLLALLFTFSRVAWIGFALAIMAVLIYLIFKNKNVLFLKTFSLSAVFIAIFSIFFISYFEIITPRFSNKSRLENKSINERILSLGESKEIIKNNFAVGVGSGNYTIYLKKHIPNKKTWEYQPVHNTFFLIFAELGVIGLALFVGILFYSLKNTVSFLNKNKTEKIFFLSSLFILLIALIFDHWVWTTSSGMLLFWLLLGLYKRD